MLLTEAASSILSFNRYAIRTIQSASEKDSAANIDVTLLRTFEDAMKSLATQVTRVIVDATTAMMSLDALEDRLTAVHELCVQETFTTAVSLDDLLWELWTILGGNQSQVRDLKRREAVLQAIERHRALAVVYVSAATHTLVKIDAGLSDLRERLMGYSVDAEHIPLEVHLASLEQSVTRLQLARTTSAGSPPPTQALIGAA